MKINPAGHYNALRLSYNGTESRSTHGKVNVESQKFPDNKKYVSDIRKVNIPLFDNNDHINTIQTKADSFSFGHLACVASTLIPLNATAMDKRDAIDALKHSLLVQVKERQDIMSEYAAPTDFSAVDALVA